MRNHGSRSGSDHQGAATFGKAPVRRMRKESDSTAWEKGEAQNLATLGNLGKRCLSSVPDLSRFMLPLRSNNDESSLGSDRILIYPHF